MPGGLSELMAECESLGMFERSAALAVFHGDLRSAVVVSADKFFLFFFMSVLLDSLSCPRLKGQEKRSLRRTQKGKGEKKWNQVSRKDVASPSTQNLRSIRS